MAGRHFADIREGTPPPAPMVTVEPMAGEGRKRRGEELWVDCAAAAAAYERLSAAQRKDFNPAALARIRGREKGGVTLHTRLMTKSSIEAFRKAAGVPLESLLANGDGLSPLKPPAVRAAPQTPRADAPKFTVTPPPNHGANWRPHPSDVDEDKGYQFSGYFEVEAAVNCDIASIGLHVMRDGHLAICTGPGKASYYNGPLPGEKRKFGYVVIDGEEEFVDASYRFLRLVRARAGQKFIVAISRWCRAIGMSRDEPLTLSIAYWLEQPSQVVSIEYVHAGKRYLEEHVFEFASDTRMALTGAHLRAVE